VAPETHGMASSATTQAMMATQRSSTIMTPSVSMSSQPMSIPSQPMPAPQLSVISQPSSAVPPLRPPSLVSTPIDQPSYQSTPTPMSQEGGIDFSLPFGAAYETQSQVRFFLLSLYAHLTRNISCSLSKNSHLMTTLLAPLPHHFRMRTRPNMHSSTTAVRPRRHQRQLRSLSRNCLITLVPAALPNHNRHSLHRHKRPNILRLKRPTTSNNRVASATVRNTLRPDSQGVITGRRRRSPLNGRGINKTIPGSSRGFIAPNQ
jgi:hypothetical protein